MLKWCRRLNFITSIAVRTALFIQLTYTRRNRLPAPRSDRCPYMACETDRFHNQFIKASVHHCNHTQTDYMGWNERITIRVNVRVVRLHGGCSPIRSIDYQRYDRLWTITKHISQNILHCENGIHIHSLRNIHIYNEDIETLRTCINLFDSDNPVTVMDPYAPIPDRHRPGHHVIKGL